MSPTDEQAERTRRLVAWCERLLGEISFSGTERDYKVRIAERVAAARAALEAGEPWLEPLGRALRGPYHLLGWRDAAAYLDWAREQPRVAERITGALWRDGAPEPFLDDLPHTAVRAPGARVSVMSVLLLGHDPATPPYRATVHTGTLDVLHRPLDPPDGLPRDLGRWRAWEALVEELRGHLPGASAIDVQGTLWWVVKRAPPTTWSTEDQQAFDAFRRLR